MTVRKICTLLLALFLIMPGTAAAQTPAPVAGESQFVQWLGFIEQILYGVCNKPHAAGDAEYYIESGGLERRFLLHTPASYNGRQRIPVVLDLHGSTSFPEQELAISQLAALAEAEGFAVVAPAGVDGFWNVPVDPAKQDDVQFISDVIDRVDTLLCIQPGRVYATGFSGGGRMVSQLACDLPDRIAAIAPVGGLRFPAPCQDSVPVVTFHGTADPINPYEGGGPDYWQTGVEDALAGWAAQNGCRVEAQEKPISTRLTEVRYVGCDRGDEVRIYRIDAMGHQWPGSPIDIGKERFGEPSDVIDATAAMWDFFRQHRLR
ncbi:MAG: polyhydroxybutyrate depolymerase [Chloroflexi bacterium]|nr:MAG: polyhydroxybutyrate depolymerase [Chloroflexota bacterium]